MAAAFEALDASHVLLADTAEDLLAANASR
jgi:hypothetical protein